MSWATNKAAVQAIMTGYREVGNVMNAEDFPESHQHKGYSFRPEKGLVGMNTTSNGQITSDVAVIEVSYINVNNSDVDINYDLFLTLQNAIKDVSGFAGWIERSFRKMKSDKLSKGILRFYLGIRSC